MLCIGKGALGEIFVLIKNAEEIRMDWVKGYPTTLLTITTYSSWVAFLCVVLYCSWTVHRFFFCFCPTRIVVLENQSRKGVSE